MLFLETRGLEVAGPVGSQEAGTRPVRSAAVLVSTAHQMCELYKVTEEVLTGGHPPVDFRLLLPVLEDEGPCSKALARRFLFFSLLAKASK